MTKRMEPGQQLLFKLFQSWEQNPDSARRKSLPISKGRASVYFETINPEDKDNLHACLVNAEKEGCVELVWGKHHDSHLLKKIWLVNGEELGEFLNLTLASDLVTVAQREIETVFPTPGEWIQLLLDRVYANWKKNQSAYRIAPGDTESLILLIKALIAVRNNEQVNLDLRTFSARILGDSKALERIRDRFAAVWNEEFSTGLGAQELYEYLGLLKFPAAIFIKGPVNVRVGNCWLPVERVSPFLGIVPDSIEEIISTVGPDYVMTIENLASFNRHCREIEDNGIIFYTAGFLGPQSSRIVRLLDEHCDKNVPFFHWGDIDTGGINIAKHVEQIISRQLNLHQMSESILQSKGSLPKKKLTRLPKEMAVESQVAQLVSIFLYQSPKLVLEQENIDPVYPLEDSDFTN